MFQNSEAWVFLKRYSSEHGQSHKAYLVLAGTSMLQTSPLMKPLFLNLP